MEYLMIYTEFMWVLWVQGHKIVSRFYITRLRRSERGNSYTIELRACPPFLWRVQEVIVKWCEAKGVRRHIGICALLNNPGPDRSYAKLIQAYGSHNLHEPG